MRTRVFLLFLSWVILGMDVEGFRAAMACKGAMEMTKEVGPLWRERDQRGNAPPAPYHPGRLYFAWNEPVCFGRHLLEEIRPAENPKISLFFPLSSSEGIEADARFTLLNEEEKPLTDALQKERGEPQRDWKGIGRDTAFFMGYQVVFAGILYFLPESVTAWTEDQKKATLGKWKENVQNPVWDKDKWWVNYIGHPYFGATYYIRARERGFGDLGSFWYSALLSALYEFGIEAFFEPPSYNDLIVTPVGGFLVGKYIFEPIRDNIKTKAQLKWYDHAALILTDPLGALNSVFERLLGLKSDVRVQFHAPVFTQQPVLEPLADGSTKWQKINNPYRNGISIGIHTEW